MLRLLFETLMMLNMLDEVINTVQLSSLIMHKIGKKKTSCIGVGMESWMEALAHL